MPTLLCRVPYFFHAPPEPEQASIVFRKWLHLSSLFSLFCWSSLLPLFWAHRGNKRRRRITRRRRPLRPGSYCIVMGITRRRDPWCPFLKLSLSLSRARSRSHIHFFRLQHENPLFPYCAIYGPSLVDHSFVFPFLFRMYFRTFSFWLGSFGPVVLIDAKTSGNYRCQRDNVSLWLRKNDWTLSNLED